MDVGFGDREHSGQEGEETLANYWGDINVEPGQKEEHHKPRFQVEDEEEVDTADSV